MSKFVGPRTRSPIRHPGRYWFRIACAVAAWSAVLPEFSLNAQDFRVDPAFLDGGRFGVRVAATPSDYYVLRRGTSPLDIAQAVDLRLGTVGNLTLADSEPASNGARFYRLERRPVTNPGDLDADGIDDVWELKNRRAGAALNPGDARQDHDGNGHPDLDDFQALTQPARASFATDATWHLIPAGEARIDVRFSRPYRGPLRFSVGGDALLQRDFTISGTAKPASQFELQVDGTTATLVVRPADAAGLGSDRDIVVNLVELPDKPYLLPVPGTASGRHVLHLTEARGNLGEARFLGTLLPTDNPAAAPIPLRMALRALGPAGMTAVLDTSGHSFLPREIVIPARLEGTTPVFGGPARGSVPLANLGRNLDWTLTFGTLAPGEAGSWTGPYRLELRGLTAGGRTDVTSGTLTLAAE